MAGSIDVVAATGSSPAADEQATKTFTGLVNSSFGASHLLQHAVVEYGHTVAHRHRLDLVVGDVHGGTASRRWSAAIWVRV